MNCLIKQPHCGLQSGQTECPKCGMRTDVRYVSQKDMDAALAKAKATWKKSDRREAANRVKVKPGNVEEPPAMLGQKAPAIAQPEAEQLLSKQELSRSKPSRSMAWVVIALLVLGGGSFAYFQHKESEAKLARAQQSLEEAQRAIQVQLTAPAPVPQAPPAAESDTDQILSRIYPGLATSVANSALGEPYRIEKSSGIEARLYRYRGAVIQVDSIDNRIVALTLDENGSKVAFLVPSIPVASFLIGKTKLSEIAGECQTKPIKRSGARTDVVYFECYFGRPGRYFNYVIGVNSTYDEEPESTKAQSRIVNWVAMIENESYNNKVESLHGDGMNIHSEYR